MKRNFILLLVFVLNLTSVPLRADTFVYDAKGRRDPFEPLTGYKRQMQGGVIKLEDVISADEVVLEGIAVGAGGRNAAIMNGEMVKINDRRGNLVIQNITRKSVYFSIRGREFSVNIQKKEL